MAKCTVWRCILRSSHAKFQSTQAHRLHSRASMSQTIRQMMQKKQKNAAYENKNRKQKTMLKNVFRWFKSFVQNTDKTKISTTKDHDAGLTVY